MRTHMIRAGIGATAAVLGLTAGVLFFSDNRLPRHDAGMTEVAKLHPDESARSFSPPPGVVVIKASREVAAEAPAGPEAGGLRSNLPAAAAETWQPAVNKGGTAPELAQRLTSTAPGDDAARAELVRSLQQELVRTSCYTGSINGAWTEDTRTAMLRLVAIANAQLPTSAPDYVLLSLARAQSAGACEVAATVAANTAGAAANAVTVAADGNATALPGRMGVGASDVGASGVADGGAASAAAGAVSEPPAVAVDPAVAKSTTPRPRGRSTEHLFLHPLGVR